MNNKIDNQLLKIGDNIEMKLNDFFLDLDKD